MVSVLVVFYVLFTRTYIYAFMRTSSLAYVLGQLSIQNPPKFFCLTSIQMSGVLVINRPSD